MRLEHVLQILIQGKNQAGPAIEDAEKSVEKLVTKIRDAQQAVDTFSMAGKSIKWLSNLFGSVLFGAIRGVLRLVTLLAFGLGSLISGFTASGMAASKYASKLEATERAFWGIAGEAAPALLDALRENSRYMLDDLTLMEQYVQGYMLTGKELADRMPEAYLYLSKVAAATHDDLDFLLERTYRSIGRLSTRWMAYIGTVVDEKEATAYAVQMHNKAADALSREEKQAAMLDLVLQKLAVRTAALPDPLHNVEQLTAMLNTTMQRLWGNFGRLFLPAARSWLNFLLQAALIVDRLVSRGGALYDFFRTISAAASVVGDLAVEAINKLMVLDDTIQTKLKKLADGILRVAWNAFSWGMRIATQLAAGLVKGASNALVAAMNFITRLLTSWLKPHSPPKVAPDIDKWGAETMELYLRGFTLASYDILEGVQQKLEAVLSGFVELGYYTGQEAARLWLDISADLIIGLDTLARTGSMTEEMFEKLSRIGGGFGRELVNLALRQYDYNTALERAELATRRLEAAQEELEASQTALHKATDDYYMALISGSSYQDLISKRAMRDASIRRRAQAEVNLELAEKEKEASEDQVDLLEERLQLQGRLIDQLVALLQKQADLQLEEDKGGGGGDKGGAGDGAFQLPEMQMPESFTGGVDDAFQELKEAIRKKFEDLFAELQTIWEESEAGKAFDNLMSALQTFKDWLDENLPLIAKKIDEISQPVRDWMKNELWQWVLDEWEEWGSWWTTEGPKIKEAIEEIKKVFTSIHFGERVEAFFESLDAFDKGFWKWVWGMIKIIPENIRLFITAITAAINGEWPKVLECIKAWLTNTWITVFVGLWEAGKGAVEGFWAGWQEAFGKWLSSEGSGGGGSGPKALRKVLIEGPEEAADEWELNIFPRFVGTVDKALRDMTPDLETLRDWFRVDIYNASDKLATHNKNVVWPDITGAVKLHYDTTTPWYEDIKTWFETTLPEKLSSLRTKFETEFPLISAAVEPVKTLLDKLFSAVVAFYNFLTTHVFSFNFDFSSLPDWGWPGSPLPIHTAWLDFANDLRRLKFDPDFQLGERSIPSVKQGSAGTSMYIEKVVIEHVSDYNDFVRQLREVAL